MRHNHRIHFGYVAAAAIAACLAAPAWAQEQQGGQAQADSEQTEGGSDEVAAIIVTGQRAADRSAINAKRIAPQIIDVVSADDIGRMADASIGDALKRIAGVNTYNYQGEPRFATIRGFNSHYITTTLDGLQIASPDNQNQNNGGGRQFYLESLPSNIASRIEVIKSSTPDMAGHSVGGSINFAIPSAFDFRSDQLRISGKGGIQLMRTSYGGNRPTYSGEAFATHRFGDFGVMLSASYWRRAQWIASAEQGGSAYWYNANGTNSGQPYMGTGPVGNERRWMLYDNDRERGSIVSKIDWRPGDRLSVALTGFYFTQNESAIRHDGLVSVGTSALVSNQAAATGTLSPRASAPGDIQSSIRTYALYFDRKTYGSQGVISYDLSDSLIVDVRGAYSHARFRNPQISDNFVQNGLAYNYQQTSEGVLFTPVNPARYNNHALYLGGPTSSPQHFVERFFTDADHYEAKGRLAYNMSAQDFGFGAEVGASYIRNTHDERYERVSQTGMPYTLADVVASNTLCSLNCNGGGIFLIDPARLQEQLDRYIDTVPAVTDIANQFNRAFGTDEKVTSGYITGRYLGENWSITGGLRLEQTDFSTNGFQTLTTRVNGQNVVAYPAVNAKSDYAHWLPSVILSYDIAPEMRVRAGYSRTIGRPKFTDMGLLGGALNVTDINNPVLTTGNPDLQPRRADNFDLSFEWYFDQNEGIFSLAGFHKRVEGEIYLLGQPGMIDIGGGALVAGSIVTPVNSDEKTTVSGVEFNLTKYFDFLPGALSNFGVSANGIVSKANFPIRLRDGTRQVLPALPNQARLTTNVALFYETERFHARVAWNHTGSFIEDRQIGSGTANAASFYRIRWFRPANIFDASVSYDVTDRLNLRVDATNITGQGAETNLGLDQEIPATRNQIPAAVMAGFAFKF